MTTMSRRASILILLLGTSFGSANAQTLTTLYQFGGLPTDASLLLGRLVQGSDGNFYGTGASGGTNGDGAVYRITSAGTITTLYQFGGLPTDGISPFAGLVQGSDGNFYGVTYGGGTNGDGTVFQITPAGTLTTLYQFGGVSTDGQEPYGPMVQGSDGYFYGTTQSGGTNNGGTMFRINSAGTLTTVYPFDYVPPDSYDPFSGVVQGSDGAFYGTSFYGGGFGFGGTVYRVSSAGTLTELYFFGVTSVTNGTNPQGTLVQGSDGYFYGSTVYGGTNGQNAGTVFRINTAGTLTTLYEFGGVPTDGVLPTGQLVQGSDGHFYGTTEAGGTNGNNGTVFRISSAGTLTTLYQFGGLPTDGSELWAGLIQGSDGYFYGTTEKGGTNGGGTVFRFSVPLCPPPYPINQITGFQLAGTNVLFAIPSIAGETYQLQFSGSMNPATWANVAGASVTNSIGALMTITNFAGESPQGFYRFAITP